MNFVAWTVHQVKWLGTICTRRLQILETIMWIHFSGFMSSTSARAKNNQNIQCFNDSLDHIKYPKLLNINRNELLLHVLPCHDKCETMSPQPRNHIHPLNPRLLRQPHLNVWFSIMASGKDRKNLLEINLANTDLIESIRQLDNQKQQDFERRYYLQFIQQLSSKFTQYKFFRSKMMFSSRRRAWGDLRFGWYDPACDPGSTAGWQRFSMSGLRDQRCLKCTFCSCLLW